MGRKLPLNEKSENKEAPAAERLPDKVRAGRTLPALLKLSEFEFWPQLAGASAMS